MWNDGMTESEGEGDGTEASHAHHAEKDPASAIQAKLVERARRVVL